MPKEQFRWTQEQFFFAVDYFSRPMAALISRFSQHQDRIDILHNIVEEHGDFNVAAYHSTTFKQFLKSIGSREDLTQLSVSPVVDAFNEALMGVSACGNPLKAAMCNGIIEYAFSDISALIAQTVIENG